MFEHLPTVAKMPGTETKIERIIALVPALEVKLDVPSIEQVHANDEVFSHHASDADNVAGVIGMMSGMMLLHDVALENMHDVEDLEGHLQREKRKTDEDEEE
jgi:hypothetical protein